MLVSEKLEKRSEGADSKSDGKVLCGSKTRDADGIASDYGGQSENVADNAAELLYIRRTLRTFADNKDKLKFVAFSRIVNITLFVSVSYTHLTLPTILRV